MPKDVTDKEKKENKHFFKDFKAELKRVIWPTPKQLVNNTIAVITIVLITAVIVFVLDLAFESMNSYGIDKIKGFVESHNEQTTNNAVNGESQNTVNNETTNNTQNNNTQANEQTNSTTNNNQATNNTVNE